MGGLLLYFPTLYGIAAGYMIGSMILEQWWVIVSMKNLEFDQGNTRNIMLHNTMEHCYGQHDAKNGLLYTSKWQFLGWDNDDKPAEFGAYSIEKPDPALEDSGLEKIQADQNKDLRWVHQHFCLEIDQQRIRFCWRSCYVSGNSTMGTARRWWH